MSTTTPVPATMSAPATTPVPETKPVPATTPKRVIIDFDNTLGVPGCDIDDSLALLALLGNPASVVLEAITTTYGNSTIEAVNEATTWLVNQLGLNIPVVFGAECAQEPISDAAHLLANQAAKYPGEIHLLMCGSLTNIKGACRIDPHFLENIASITAMGGLRESLYFNDTICDELNFSCDADALELMLMAPCKPTIAVSQNCLPAVFDCATFRSELSEYPWMVDACADWFSRVQTVYRMDSFIGWDICAALYLARPELFNDHIESVTLNKRFLQVGLLESAKPGWPCAQVNFPTINNPQEFRAEAYRSIQCALDNPKAGCKR